MLLGTGVFFAGVRLRPAPGLFEQAHDLSIRDLVEVPVPEADGLEVGGS
jgi:hypothetical protein